MNEAEKRIREALSVASIEPRDERFKVDTDDLTALLADRDEREAKLRAEIDRLTRERGEGQALCDKLAGILSRTVNALRGDPPPLTLWGWDDLPERAAAMRTEREKERIDFAQLYLTLTDAMGYEGGEAMLSPEEYATELARDAALWRKSQIEQKQSK